MSFDAARLYALLPPVYRIRDAEQGEPLRAFLSVIAEQVAVLEADLAQLYDDQFVETCAEWVVPYIGDLVGTRGLTNLPDETFSRRALVANSLAYRRRKGTAAVLEQLARDVTGWDARVVEFFQLLATTQYMNHLRPENIAWADVRRWEVMENIDTAFERAAHTVEVRRVEKRKGRYNIPHVGLFLFRIQSHSLTDAPAYMLDARRFLFNPLGLDAPLYNLPATEAEITHLAEPVNLPVPLSRRVLERDIDVYYGANKSLHLTVNGTLVDAFDVQIANLTDSDWGWAHEDDDKFLIDPLLGRLVLPQTLGSHPPPDVRATFHYGFGAEMGGGEYQRAGTFEDDAPTLHKIPDNSTPLQSVLDNLTGDSTVEIESNDYFIETPRVVVPPGARFEIRASDKHRPILVLDGDMSIEGGEDARLAVNGLLLSGGALLVPDFVAPYQHNELRSLKLRHCTLLPIASPPIGDVPALALSSRLVVEARGTNVEIDRCIVGAIRAIDGARVRITDSIIDAGAETGVAYAGLDGAGAGASLELENCTVVGKVRALTLEASNTIFLARRSDAEAAAGLWPVPVGVENMQEGCVRFSWLPPGSQVPRAYRCQPKKECCADRSQPLKACCREHLARVSPIFTSLRYGDAAYGQLSLRCAVEIREGADDQSEMGAFHHLHQPQREANLRARLDEYLRFGLEAGIFYAS